MAKKTVKIGTRISELAMWQANYVKDLLEEAGLETEIVAIETKGDKILHKTISKIGSKGVFTEELERMLHDGEVDIAVHSAKDMPSTLPKGLELIAYGKREKSHDVVVSFNADFKLEAADKWLVGTSSTRRIAMLKRFYPNIRTTNMRGNLQTRFRKLEEGQCDALLLAYAGVHRMGYEKHIVEHLNVEEFTPQAGQGAITIEASTKMDKELKRTIRECVNDKEAEQCILAERSFLKELDGGCSIPSFVSATINAKKMYINAGIIGASGKKLVRKKADAPIKDHKKLGQQIAREVLKNGGDKILAQFKKK